MPDSQICLNARIALDKVARLKSDFTDAYTRCSASGDVRDRENVQALFVVLQEQLTRTRDKIWSEKIEHIFSLKEQYRSQVHFLNRLGVLQQSKDRTGNMVIVDCNENECVLPSYEEVLAHIAEKRELLEMKMDQGFTKLLLVPFAMKVDSLIKKLNSYLVNDQPNFIKKLGLRSEPVSFIQSAYLDAERKQSLIYEPGAFCADHKGKTKQQILVEQQKEKAWDSGWRILLAQSERNGKGIRPLVKAGDGKTMGELSPRSDLERKKVTSLEYLQIIENLKNDPTTPYYGEKGMTPEEWIMANITHIEETGKLLDVSVALLTGSYFSSTNQIPIANADLGGVHNYILFDEREPNNLYGSCGIRHVVQV